MGKILHKRDKPVARHCWEFHDGRITDFKFTVIEVVKPSGRKGDIDRILLQKETEWIYRLKSTNPDGLNESLYFGCFI